MPRLFTGINGVGFHALPSGISSHLTGDYPLGAGPANARSIFSRVYLQMTNNKRTMPGGRKALCLRTGLMPGIHFYPGSVVS